jgi:hypothetical protein
MVIFLTSLLSLTALTILFTFKYIKTRHNRYAKALMAIWFLPAMLIGVVIYQSFPITKDRIVGSYSIDTNFYPGSNANWQKEHFSFEITENDEFLFYEKLEDGSIKTIIGKVEYFRESPPMLFRIRLNEPHPLIDPYPSLYRGNRKFYYVFESKFGNMFYRKVGS